MAEITTPRNAIGNFSGAIMPQNQGVNAGGGQNKYSNIMSRRKSNAHHGPVDIAAMMRANRGPITGGATDGQGGQGASIHHQRNQGETSNISSRGLRANVMLNKPEDGGLHLPPMPLTPTEQMRQKERERNSSNQKNQNTGGAHHSKARDVYDMQQNYQMTKRPRDNSAGVQDINSQTRNYQNGMAANNQASQGNVQNQNNAQKMKMLYKKQINSHRATSQTTAINPGSAARDGSNLQTQRNVAHTSHFSP